MFWYDYTLIILLPGILLGLIAQVMMRSTYEKYARIKSVTGLTGYTAARKILDGAGLYHVQIERIGGDLSDHFDPGANVLRLSQGVYDSSSVAAIGVAAHECGHAIQYANQYLPMKVRGALVKTTNFDRGDLCGFTWNNKLLIKRVIGIPGDWIEIDTDGTVYLNGERLEEPYVAQQAFGECDLVFPFQVPQEQYFVIGDMRESSIDSRNTLIGCIPKDQIVGKVFLRVWPLASFEFF